MPVDVLHDLNQSLVMDLALLLGLLDCLAIDGDFIQWFTSRRSRGERGRGWSTRAMSLVLVGYFLGTAFVEAALSWLQVHVNMHAVHVDDFHGALNFPALVRLFASQKCSEVQLNNLFELRDRLWE